MRQFPAVLCVQLLLASRCVTASVIGNARRTRLEESDNGCAGRMAQPVRPAWVEGLACGKRRNLVASEGLYGHSGAFQLLRGHSQQRLPADTFGEGIAYEPSSDTFFQLTLDDAEVWQFRAADLALVRRFPLPGAAKGAGMFSALKALDSGYVITGTGAEPGVAAGAGAGAGGRGRHAAPPPSSFEEQLQHTAGLHPEDAALAAEIAALAGGSQFLQLTSGAGRQAASGIAATAAGDDADTTLLTELTATSSSAESRASAALPSEVQAIKQAWGLAYDSTRRLMWLSDGSLRLHALASDMSAHLATGTVSFPPGVAAACPHSDVAARGSSRAADEGGGAAAATVEGNTAPAQDAAETTEAANEEPVRLNELEYVPPDALAHAFAAAAAALSASGAGSAGQPHRTGPRCRKQPGMAKADARRQCTAALPSVGTAAAASFSATNTSTTPSSFGEAGEIWAAVPGCVAILRVSACDFSATGWLDFRAAAALPDAPHAAGASHCNDKQRHRRRTRRRKSSLELQQGVLDNLAESEPDGLRPLADSSALIRDARIVASEITLRARREGHLNGLAVCYDSNSRPELFIAGKHWTALLQADLAAVLLAGGAAC